MSDIKTFPDFKDRLLAGCLVVILSLVGHTWFMVNTLVVKEAVREAMEIQEAEWKVKVDAEISALKTGQSETGAQLKIIQDILKPEETKIKTTVIR